MEMTNKIHFEIVLIQGGIIYNKLDKLLICKFGKLLDIKLRELGITLRSEVRIPSMA
jgi:hypothetical protein